MLAGYEDILEAAAVVDALGDVDDEEKL